MYHVCPLFQLNFSLTFTPLLSDILKNVVLVGMLTDQSFVRSPSTTSRSFYRWTRRYWAHLAPHTENAILNSSVLTSLSGSSQESWASDLSRVREFLTGYMRGGPQSEPMLQLDEVKHRHSWNKLCSVSFYFLPHSVNVLRYVSSSWRSCSPKRTLYVTLDSRLLLLMTWKGRCLSTGSPLHTTRRSQHLCLKCA